MTYAIRNAAGHLVRLVNVSETAAAQQAGPGETVAPARPADELEAQAQKDAIRTKLAALKAQQPDQTEVLLEALRGKGLDLSKADLDAAAATLQARRTPPAGARK